MLGRAEIHIKENGERTAVETVTVEYTNYSDDGIRVLNGTESVTRRRPSPFDTELDWHSDLVQSGCTSGTKLTSEDGFSMSTNVFNPVFQASGTLTTTLDGRVFTQPVNGT